MSTTLLFNRHSTSVQPNSSGTPSSPERETRWKIERKRGQAQRRQLKSITLSPAPCEPTHRGREGGNREIKEEERIRQGLCARASTVSSLLRTAVCAVSFSSQTRCRLTIKRLSRIWIAEIQHSNINTYLHLAQGNDRVHPPPVYRAICKEIIRFFPPEQTV